MIRTTVDQRLARLQMAAIAVGVAATGASIVAVAIDRATNFPQYLQSYLTSYLYWLGIPLGCQAVTLTHLLTGGRWGQAIRPLLRSAVQTLPLMAVLFLPLALNLGLIYVWAGGVSDRGRAIEGINQQYLNVPGFQVRAAVYFAFWCGLSWIIARGLGRIGLSPTIPKKLQLVGGLGLVVQGLTVTGAAVDWAMSLEPHWYSTMYGGLFFIGQALVGLAFVAMLAALWSTSSPWADIVTRDHLNDLGNLLLTLVIVWAYLAFSQFLIIWSGNLPDENIWYVVRSQGTWLLLPTVLAIFHFAVPFALLLSRDVKRQPRRLAAVGALLLAMRWVDLDWVVRPAFHPHGFIFSLYDFLSLAAIGGWWLALFSWNLRRRLAANLIVDAPERFEKT